MRFDFIMIVPLLLSHCGFSFVCGCGVSFLVSSSVFLSMAVQQLVVIPVVLHEGVSARPSVPPPCCLLSVQLRGVPPVDLEANPLPVLRISSDLRILPYFPLFFLYPQSFLFFFFTRPFPLMFKYAAYPALRTVPGTM